ncbi:unnamed protein product [Pleuronectes platessa]|uniref:Uncharacterized protein n=1 Tax=Pleuronectes platessa TaxID=8262 RepID=A0A9N7Z807_PLEPL|nr:unnamed protein product [Pleuronectes platessa]
MISLAGLSERVWTTETTTCQQDLSALSPSSPVPIPSSFADNEGGAAGLCGGVWAPASLSPPITWHTGAIRVLVECQRVSEGSLPTMTDGSGVTKEASIQFKATFGQ